MRFLVISLHRMAPFDQTWATSSCHEPVFESPSCVHRGKYYGRFLMASLMRFTKKTIPLNPLKRTNSNNSSDKNSNKSSILFEKAGRDRCSHRADPFKAEHRKPGSGGQGGKNIPWSVTLHKRRKIGSHRADPFKAEHGKLGSNGH